MSKELTCTASVIIGDRVVDWNDLTEDEHAQIKKNMCSRLSTVMSEYYSLHPQQLASLREYINTKEDPNVHTK